MLCARVSPLLVAAAALVAAPSLAAGQAAPQSGTATRPDAVGHTASVSPRGAEVDFDLSDGSRLTVAAVGGVVKVNGDSVGTYAPGSPFEKVWRALAAKAGDVGTPQLVCARRSLPAGGMGPGAPPCPPRRVPRQSGPQRSSSYRAGAQFDQDFVDMPQAGDSAAS